MREAKTIKLKDGSRDVAFIVKPMSAIKAEMWLYRAALAVGLPAIPSAEEFSARGILMALATKSVDFDKVEGLLNDLLACCEYQADGGVTVPVTPETVSAQVDYPTTLFELRLAVLVQTFGFFGNGGWQNFLGQLNGVVTALR